MAKRWEMTRRSGRFVVSPIRLVLGRAHAELDRALDFGEGLSPAIDEPAPLARILELAQLGIGGLERVVLLPLAQGPFG